MTTETKTEKWIHFEHRIVLERKSVLNYHRQSPESLDFYVVYDQEEKAIGTYDSLGAAKYAIEKYWLERSETQVIRIKEVLKSAEENVASFRTLMTSHN